jgi:hypothetical protein
MSANEFFCHSCQNEVQIKKIEEKKEEETLCFYCLKGNKKNPCIILWHGKASCLDCKTNEKNKIQPVIVPDKPSNKLKNHHKTSSDS